MNLPKFNSADGRCYWMKPEVQEELQPLFDQCRIPQRKEDSQCMKMTAAYSPRDAYRLMLKDYPDVMDIGQMCEALGVSTKTGYKLLKDGKIEYLKIGRAYRIPKAHILRYLKITCSTFAE